MHMMLPTRIRFARDKESEYVQFRTETDDTRNYTLHIKWLHTTYKTVSISKQYDKRDV